PDPGRRSQPERDQDSAAADRDRAGRRAVRYRAGADARASPEAPARDDELRAQSRPRRAAPRRPGLGLRDLRVALGDAAARPRLRDLEQAAAELVELVLVCREIFGRNQDSHLME